MARVRVRVSYVFSPHYVFCTRTTKYIYNTGLFLQVCLSQTPVVISLILSRHVGVFKFRFFCKAWRIFFKILQRLSVHLVLLLSVSRTISLTRPLIIINKNAVLACFYGYIAVICVEVSVLSWRENIQFYHDAVYCYEWDNWKSWYNKTGVTIFMLCIGGSSIIIFTSFIISVVSIRKSMRTRLDELENMHCSAKQPLKRQATHTIIIFTLIYMICNVPNFVNMVLFIYTLTSRDYPGPVYSNTFMYYYSWNLFEILSVLINSTLNPIVYFCRISQYKMWIKQIFQVLCCSWTRNKSESCASNFTLNQSSFVNNTHIGHISQAQL